MIITISGGINSGKTLLADEIYNVLTGMTIAGSLTARFHKYNFATPVKQAVSDLLGVSLAEIECDKRNPDRLYRVGARILNMRQILRLVGTDVMQKTIYPEIWADKIISEIQSNHDDIAVIGDLRFNHELEELSKRLNHAHQIFTIRVLGGDEDPDSEICNNSLDSFDFIVSNENKHADMRKIAFAIVSEMLSLNCEIDPLFSQLC